MPLQRSRKTGVCSPSLMITHLFRVLRRELDLLSGVGDLYARDVFEPHLEQHGGDDESARRVKPWSESLCQWLNRDRGATILDLATLGTL